MSANRSEPIDRVDEPAADRVDRQRLPDSPTVSVVIPMRNEEQFIGRCLESFLAQDYDMSKVEVVVVDGRSTDRSRDVVQAFAKTHPNLKLLDNPKRITPAAMNLGIQSSTGDLIIILGAHSASPPEFLSRCAETAVRTGADVVGGVLSVVPGADTLMARTIQVFQGHPLGMGGARHRVGGKEGPVDMLPFACFRRDVFARVGLFDERLVRSQDNEMDARIVAAGGTIWFSPRITNYYYARPTLRTWLRMLFINGSWHAYLIRILPSAFRFRYLVPLAFFLIVTGGVLAGLAWRPAWLLAAAALGAHLALSVLASIQLAARHGWDLLLTLPWFFSLCHLWYGAATLIGVFKHGFVGLGERPEPTRPAVPVWTVPPAQAREASS